MALWALDPSYKSSATGAVAGATGAGAVMDFGATGAKGAFVVTACVGAVAATGAVGAAAMVGAAGATGGVGAVSLVASVSCAMADKLLASTPQTARIFMDDVILFIGFTANGLEGLLCAL